MPAYQCTPNKPASVYSASCGSHLTRSILLLRLRDPEERSEDYVGVFDPPSSDAIDAIINSVNGSEVSSRRSPGLVLKRVFFSVWCTEPFFNCFPVLLLHSRTWQVRISRFKESHLGKDINVCRLIALASQLKRVLALP